MSSNVQVSEGIEKVGNQSVPSGKENSRLLSREKDPCNGSKKKKKRFCWLRMNRRAWVRNPGMEEGLQSASWETEAHLYFSG